MLRLAIDYRDKLNQQMRKTAFDPKYTYYHFSTYRNYKVDIAEDSWNMIQMVSVDSDENVLGYLSCGCNRSCNKVHSIGAINFGTVNIGFSRDFYEFLTSLFTVHSFNKIEWEVVVGNPAEKIYDKIVDKYGGRIVGTRIDSTVLMDGSFHDVKEYEIFKKDFLNVYKKRME